MIPIQGYLQSSKTFPLWVQQLIDSKKWLLYKNLLWSWIDTFFGYATNVNFTQLISMLYNNHAYSIAIITMMIFLLMMLCNVVFNWLSLGLSYICLIKFRYVLNVSNYLNKRYIYIYCDFISLYKLDTYDTQENITM